MSDIKETQSQEFAPPPGTEVHVYDGIVEHDNFLPRWWLGILYGSIIFGALYVGYYIFGPGPTLVQEYDAALAARKAQVAAAPAAPQAAGKDDASLKSWAADAAHITQGKGVYDAKCAVCHGPVGEGGIGPNMTDDFWLHGAKPSEMAATVTNGVADKGMPPWGALLSADDLKSVVAYVRTLHGTNPPNGKAPQGEKVAFE